MVRVLTPLAASLIVFCACALGAGASSTPGVSTPSSDVWEALRRPLRFPALAPGTRCPHTPTRTINPAIGAAIGGGPAYAVLDGAALIFRPVPVTADGWRRTKVLWVANPTVHGPVLVRGRQLDGAGAPRFEAFTDTGQQPELRLSTDQSARPVTPRGTPVVAAAGWATWPSLVYARVPGCYAFQIDGPTFSEVIVVAAVFVDR